MSQGYIQVPQNASPNPYAQQGYGYPPSSPGGYVPPQQAGGYSQYPAQGYANQPVPQVAAVPAPYFGGLQYVYVADPMTELGLSTGVLIRQEAQFLEQLTGCESPNRYYVFSQSPQAGMKLLFKCKEYSECCMRNCCPANNREFNMAIKHIATAANLDENFSTPFIDVRKPCKCTCFCLERPEMLVRFGNQGQTLGRIKQPFTCCDPVFSTYDSTGIVKYTIHGDCCQCGLLCKNNFCGKLSEVTFNIYKGNNNSKWLYVEGIFNSWYNFFHMKNSIWLSKAEDRHYLSIPKGGAWTLMFEGRPRHKWGFYVNGHKWRPLRYFHKYGIIQDGNYQ